MRPVYPTTEIEAVNLMLSVLGEAPLSSLEDTGHGDAVIAVSILRDTTRMVEAEGWHWNTEEKWRLTPSYPEGYLYLPNNTLRVDTVRPDQNIDVVARGTRLWDRTNHTFTFEKGVYVDVVVGLDFEEIPQTARSYIAIRSGRIYQERFLGAVTLSDFTMRDELAARADLAREDAESADYNMLRSDPINKILMR